MHQNDAALCGSGSATLIKIENASFNNGNLFLGF
jgi:hypothetical protein